MAVEWFIQHNDKVLGPVSSKQLKAAVDQGKVHREFRICRSAEGKPDEKWVKAENVKGLFNSSNNPTPQSQIASQGANAATTYPDPPAREENTQLDFTDAPEQQTLVKKWYVAINDEQSGPFSKNELAELPLSPDSLLWSEGSADWMPLREIAELSHLTSAIRSAQAVPIQSAPQSHPPNTISTTSHEIDYEIFGAELQIVEVELDPNETVIAEAGAMAYMDSGINFEARMGDGSKPNEGFFGSLLAGAKRAVSGESFFMTHFTNISTDKKRVAFAAPYPGNIIPINLLDFNRAFTCQKDAFLCAAMGTSIGIAFAKKLGAGFFGGEGFILQRIEGDGLAFIQAGGTVIKKELAGDSILVDTGCLVGFTDGIQYTIEKAGNLKSMIFGGEGLFLAKLEGHGTVMLQSLPFSRLADRIIANAPSIGGSSSGEGSILGGIADMFSD